MAPLSTIVDRTHSMRVSVHVGYATRFMSAWRRQSYLYAVPGVRAQWNPVQCTVPHPSQIERRSPCMGQFTEHASPLFAHEVQPSEKQLIRRQEAEHYAQRVAAREVLCGVCLVALWRGYLQRL
jgi:hypothetical protein